MKIGIRSCLDPVLQRDDIATHAMSLDNLILDNLINYMLYIGADHGGYKTKEYLKEELAKKGFALEDLGPFKLDPKDDYPIVAHEVAEAVTKEPKKNIGILFCRSGQGVCITANRHKDVRAALAWTEKLAKMSRQDDLANVICIPSDYVKKEDALKIILAFLKTPWGTESRFKRRAKEIEL